MSNQFTLWKLTESLKEFKEYCETIDTTNQEELEAMMDTLESIDLAIKDKLDGCAKIIDTWSVEAAMLEEKAKQFKDMASTRRNKIIRLQDYMLQAMNQSDIKQLNTELGKVSVVNNGGMRKLTIKVKPAELPENLQKTEIKPDTKAIRQLIKDGGETAEQTDMWTLEPQGQHVRIEGRTK